MQIATPTDTGVAPPDDLLDPIDSSLAQYLIPKLEKWKSQREPQFLLYEQNFKHRECIAEDGDTHGSGIPKATKGKEIFIGSTRNKVRAGTAKTMDSQRVNGRYPYTIDTDFPQLSRHAVLIQKLTDKLLDEDNTWSKMDRVNYSGGTYGTGFFLGPFGKRRDFEKAVAIDENMRPITKKFSFVLPHLRYGNNMDIIPDPECSDFNGDQKGIGFFWRQMLQQEGVQDLADMVDPITGKPLYKHLQRVLDIGAIDPSSRAVGIDRLKTIRGNQNYFAGDGRFAHWFFSGLVPVGCLMAWLGMTEIEYRNTYKIDLKDPLTRRIEANCEILGGIVVRAEVNKFAGARRPAAKFTWEQNEDFFDGVGIPTNNATYQNIINGATRMWFQAKTLSIMAPFIYNPDMFIPGQSFKWTPNKGLKLKSWVKTKQQAEAAMFKMDFPDNSNGWLEPIEFAEKASDEGTGLPKYVQGSPEASHLNPTASGIQMIMGAAFTPLKVVMINWDKMFLEVITAYFNWMIENLDPALVGYWFSEEDMELWNQIQKAGTLSAFKIKVTGTQSFERKQILFSKFGAIWQMGLQNPEVAKIINWTLFFQLLWKAADIGDNAPVYTEQELDKMMQKGMQAQQAAIQAQQDAQARIVAAEAQVKLAVQDMKSDTEIEKAHIQADSKKEKVAA